jgi:hypothetical protein
MPLFSKRRSQSDLAAQLEAAHAAVAGINDQIAERSRVRAERLVDDDANMDEVARMDREIVELRKRAGLFGERIQGFQRQLAQHEAERRAKEHQQLIERVEKRFAERDAAGAELSKHLLAAEKAFRKLLALNDEISAAWPFSTLDRVTSVLVDRATVQALQSELFRIGHVAFIGGNSAAVVRPSFPGGRCPDLRLSGLPEMVTPLTEVLKSASAYASAIMRGGTSAELNGQLLDEPLAPLSELMPDMSGPKVDAKVVQAGMKPHVLGTH